MTGRQEYDRTKDRQRILDEYMIDRSAFCKYDRMTGRQEYDRTKDRQRILDEYMIDVQANALLYNYLT
jgi:hypothetical protein